MARRSPINHPPSVLQPRGCWRSGFGVPTTDPGFAIPLGLPVAAPMRSAAPVCDAVAQVAARRGTIDVLFEDSGLERHFSFPMAPRTWRLAEARMD